MAPESILTPIHPRWNEFIDELSRMLICLKTTENARAVMSLMPGIDIEGSIDALRWLGGRCDCEIVFEVAGVAERSI